MYVIYVCRHTKSSPRPHPFQQTRKKKNSRANHFQSSAQTQGPWISVKKQKQNFNVFPMYQPKPCYVPGLPRVPLGGSAEAPLPSVLLGHPEQRSSGDAPLPSWLWPSSGPCVVFASTGGKSVIPVVPIMIFEVMIRICQN